MSNSQRLFIHTELHATGRVEVCPFSVAKQPLNSKRFYYLCFGNTHRHHSATMDSTTERIIQVSLSKITDSRRRRGGPTLRRNLLVSHILNSVLTASNPAYATYRNTVDIDVELDNADTESLALDKPKVTRTVDCDASLGTGNGQECVGHSPVSANGRTSKAGVEITQQRLGESEKAAESDHVEAGRVDSRNVCGVKRPRTEYANDVCDKHAVTNKRCRSESCPERRTDLEKQEPMDISGLISVFSGGFGGLSSPASDSSPPPLSRPSYSFNSWSQTVEAF